MVRKILIVTAFPPNEKTAGQDYTRRMIKDMINHGIEVDIIYANYFGHEVNVSQKANIICTLPNSKVNCIKKLKYHPFFTKRYSKKIVRKINQIKNQYDMLYFDFSQVHIYSKYIEHDNKVLMCHDVIAQKYGRKSNPCNLFYIKNTEKNFLSTATTLLTFSKKDSELIKKFYGLNSKSVNFYIKEKQGKNLENVYNDVFCFYGAWNRKENIESIEYFINKVLPLIKIRYHYVIIGGSMTQKLINMISEYDEFSYLGFVDDPIIEISKCQALIAPLHQGAGVKVKIVDSLTSGTPVIGTQVAFEGLTDNEMNRMFWNTNDEKEMAYILNNWEPINKDYKRSASIEFICRYNKNHFVDSLIE